MKVAKIHKNNEFEPVDSVGTLGIGDNHPSRKITFKYLCLNDMNVCERTKIMELQ
jgi:hypothetical protein